MYTKNRIFHVSVRLTSNHMDYLKAVGSSRYNNKNNISVVIRSLIERCMINDKQSDINDLLPERGISETHA